MPKSAYILAIENLSSVTRCRDIRYECEAFGTVLAVERDMSERLALVEYKHSADAKAAWKRLDGMEVDGRAWAVDWATKKDTDFMGWAWEEGDGYADRDRGDDRGGHTRTASPVREHASG